MGGASHRVVPRPPRRRALRGVPFGRPRLGRPTRRRAAGRRPVRPESPGCGRGWPPRRGPAARRPTPGSPQLHLLSFIAAVWRPPIPPTGWRGPVTASTGDDDDHAYHTFDDGAVSRGGARPPPPRPAAPPPPAAGGAGAGPQNGAPKQP